MPDPQISVVVPVYDEAACLPATLARLFEALEELDRPWEVLGVDDGSRDGSRALLTEAARAEPRLRVLAHDRNRGKGAAIRTGVGAARGESIVFLDADLSTDLSALRPLVRALDGGCDFALGSRRIPGALITRRQPRLRQWLGHAFSLLAAGLLAPEVRDFTCGFKGLRAPAARELFARSRVDGWAFDPELVAIARARGLSIEQIPVRWGDAPGSKVRLGSAAVSSFLDLLRVAWRASRGRYGPGDRAPASER